MIHHVSPSERVEQVERPECKADALPPMTDFKKWDRFDADAAEKEVERKVGAHQAGGLGCRKSSCAAFRELSAPVPL